MQLKKVSNVYYNQQISLTETTVDLTYADVETNKKTLRIRINIPKMMGCEYRKWRYKRRKKPPI